MDLSRGLGDVYKRQVLLQLVCNIRLKTLESRRVSFKPIVMTAIIVLTCCLVVSIQTLGKLHQG
jgi:heme/copper-type cytochrome/quinol oxidase subunit 4